MRRIVAVIPVLIVAVIGMLAGEAGAQQSTSATARGAVPGPVVKVDDVKIDDVKIDNVKIDIDDVDRFYKIYDAAGGHPTADQLQHDYLDPGSDGLHHLAKVRNVSGTAIAKTLTEHPEIYSDAKRCMVVLPRVRQRLETALLKLGDLYPEAKFPPVTILVGKGKPVAVGAQNSGVQVGLEALCATNWLNPNVEDRFVHVIAHEYAHTQQSRVLADDEHPTVLELSLIEGAAEFTAELISGDVAYSQFGASTNGKRKSRRRSSPTKTTPTSLNGLTTARGKSRATSATGSDIASPRLTTSMLVTSARPCAKSWK